MNIVMITGRLTRDPEMRYVGSGERRFPICTMNVAVDNGYSRFNRNTSKSEVESGFYRVEVVGEYGEAINAILAKGNLVYVVGSLSQYQTQPKSGESQSRTTIRADMCMALNAQGAGGGTTPTIPPPNDQMGLVDDQEDYGDFGEEPF